MAILKGQAPLTGTHYTKRKMKIEKKRKKKLVEKERQQEKA